MKSFIYFFYIIYLFRQLDKNNTDSNNPENAEYWIQYRSTWCYIFKYVYNFTFSCFLNLLPENYFWYTIWFQILLGAICKNK